MVRLHWLFVSFACCTTAPPEDGVLRIPLRHVSVDEVLPILVDLTSPIVYCRPRCDENHGPPRCAMERDAGSNTLIARGAPDDLSEVAKLVARLDVPGEPSLTAPAGCGVPRNDDLGILLDRFVQEGARER